MTLFSLCGVAVCAALCAALLKEWQGKLSHLVPLVGTLGAAVFVLLRYGSLLGELLSFADRSGLSTLGVLLVKILAIAYLTTLAADLCRELGEASLGARVEWCGKAEILLLCLPKFWELAELALGLIEGI